MSNILKVLESAVIPSMLAETAHLAIATLGEGVVLNQGGGTPQSSMEFAKTYALRRDIGYFGKQRIYGLDETIALLDSFDRPVNLSYVQTGKGLVSIWREAKDQSICGLLLIPTDQGGRVVDPLS